MNRKNLLRVSVILLIVFINLAYSSPPKDGDFDGDDYGIRDPNPSRDDRRKKDGYRGVENSGYGKGDRGRYDGGVNGYYDDDDDEYRRKGIIGYGGKDPRRNGIDFGDYGPVFGKNNSMLSRLNVWISSADDWEEKRSGKYGSDKYGSDKYDSDKYGSDKYDSDKYGSDKYDSDRYDSGKKSYKNNQRRKRSYSKVTFPVKQVKNYKKFPFFRFPPLISIAPWLPIFYDKLTYQTFIFSLTGGLYIIPPIINFYGQRFAVAQLIKWGYASLVSSGVPPPPNINVAPLVQPAPPAGPVPGYNQKTNQFNDGVKTDFYQFRPQNNPAMQSRGNSQYNPSPNYR